jgi:hypothetical protein
MFKNIPLEIIGCMVMAVTDYFIHQFPSYVEKYNKTAGYIFFIAASASAMNPAGTLLARRPASS